MTYQILVEGRVEKETKQIPSRDRQKIDQTIQGLATQPRPHGCTKLTDKEGYRIRVGNYRILYTIDDDHKTIVIYRIKIRNEKTYK